MLKIYLKKYFLWDDLYNLRIHKTQRKRSRLEAKKSNNFDWNSKRKVLSKKTTQKLLKNRAKI